jgi:hypothetical protein
MRNSEGRQCTRGIWLRWSMSDELRRWAKALDYGGAEENSKNDGRLGDIRWGEASTALLASACACHGSWCVPTRTSSVLEGGGHRWAPEQGAAIDGTVADWQPHSLPLSLMISLLHSMSFLKQNCSSTRDPQYFLKDPSQTLSSFEVLGFWTEVLLNCETAFFS